MYAYSKEKYLWPGIQELDKAENIATTCRAVTSSALWLCCVLQRLNKYFKGTWKIIFYKHFKIVYATQMLLITN